MSGPLWAPRLFAASSFCHELPLNTLLISADTTVTSAESCGPTSIVHSHVLTDPETRWQVRIPASIEAHDYVKLTSDPTRVLAVPRKVGGLELLDIVERRVITTVLPSAPDRQFSGHAAASPDGRILFVPEWEPTGKVTGRISLRDPGTLQNIGEFSSYGIHPHHVQIAPDNKVLVVTNVGKRDEAATGEGSNVALIEISSGKLIKVLESNPRVKLTHLGLFAGTKLAVSCSHPKCGEHNEGTLFFADTSNQLSPVAFTDYPAGGAVHSQALTRGDISWDICVIPKFEKVAVSYPRQNKIVFMSFDGRYLGSVATAKPWALALARDGRKIYVGSENGQLLSIDSAKQVLLPEYALVPLITGNGRHLVRLF